jgi:hypothetical protein
MYSFEITDISVKDSFFNYQQQFFDKAHNLGVIYVAALQCSLEGLLDAVECIPASYCDDIDVLRSLTIGYWLAHCHEIDSWRDRFYQVNRASANRCHVIVCRLVHVPTYCDRLESMMQK